MNNFNNFNVIKEEEDPNVNSKITFDHRVGGKNTTLCEKSFYYEPISGGSDICNFLSMLPDRQYLYYKLLEFVFAKVAIVDNRIWEAKDREIGKKSQRKLQELWEKQRVYILNVKEAIDNFEEFVNGLIDNYDFLIFHQGEIDEIIKRNNEENFNTHWKKLKEKAKHVIIDTGRGKPEQAIKEGLRWVQWSILQSIMIDKIKDHSKLHLT